MAAAIPAVAAAKELTFEQAFAGRGRPPALHYRAAFVSGGAEHRVEVWRDGDERLRRRTDDVLETYAFHEPGGPEYDLSVLDLRRRIHTRIARTNLFRIGSFTDWSELAYGLRRPRGEYRVAAITRPAMAHPAIGSCEWYELSQDGRRSRVCWSRKDRLPLVIEVAAGQVVWRVVALERGPVPPATFEIHDQGFVRNDANADIERD